MITIARKIWRKKKLWKVKAYKGISALRGMYEYNILSNFRSLPPKEMIINLTYWCNSRCKMCNIWQVRPKNEMSFEEWEKVMKDPVFKTIEALTISGGEATLHPKFFELSELFVKSMPKLYQLNVITNGFMTDYIVERVKKLITLCKQNNVHLNISVSIDGIGKVHEDIRRIPNAFEKSSRTLLELKKLQKKHDFSIGSGSLLLRQNLDKIDDVKKWFKKNDIPLNFQIVGFHETFVDNLETQKDLDFKATQNKLLIKTLQKLAKSEKKLDFQSYYWKDLIGMYRDGLPRTTPCPFQKDQFVLDSWGDVYYCLSVPKIGNCRKTGNVSRIYYGKKNEAYRKKLTNTACLKCNSGCNVPYAMAKDAKKFAWYKLTGKPWYGLKTSIKQLIQE